MIISRYRATVKRGHLKEAIELIKTNPAAKRVSTTLAGDNDILHVDFEFEDMAAYAAAAANLPNALGPNYESYYGGTASEIILTNRNDVLMTHD